VNFLVDMPLSPGLAQWLREHGHSAVHAASLGLDRAPDTELMDYAKREGCTIVTADLDYPRLLAAARSSEPSIVLFRDGDWSEADAIARIAQVLQAIPSEDIRSSIIVVERDRVRRRRLPL
jgi:predicted nuclease of predicted toxin-antitoxin system